MTDNFFAIKLILRYGAAGAVVLAVLVGAAALGLLWPSIGWFTLIIAPLAGGFAFLIGKSYVELVGIVFQMVH